MPLLSKTKLTLSFEIWLFLTQLCLNLIFFSISKMILKIWYHTICSHLLNYVCKKKSNSNMTTIFLETEKCTAMPILFHSNLKCKIFLKTSNILL
jgi:hypothetical protein